MTIKDFLKTGRNLADYFRTGSSPAFTYTHFVTLIYNQMDASLQERRPDEYYYYKSVYMACVLYLHEPLSLYSWRFFVYCYRGYCNNRKLP